MILCIGVVAFAHFFPEPANLAMGVALMGRYLHAGSVSPFPALIQVGVPLGARSS
jgi:hypothetical protein